MYLRGWVETEDYSRTATIWIWRSLQFPVTISAGHILGCLLGLLRSTLGWILLSNNNHLNTKMLLVLQVIPGLACWEGWRGEERTRLIFSTSPIPFLSSIQSLLIPTRAGNVLARLGSEECTLGWTNSQMSETQFTPCGHSARWFVHICQTLSALSQNIIINCFASIVLDIILTL